MNILKRQKTTLVITSLSLICSFGIFLLFNQPKDRILVDFDLNQVHVAVLGKRVSGGQIEFTAHFDPQSEFSLYAAKLPMLGVNGLGRPTRFSVYSTNLEEQGNLIERPAAHYKIYPELKVRLPIYAAGRVELVRRFKLTNINTVYTIEFVFNYMSCSSNGGCTIPVLDKKVKVRVSKILQE